MACNSVASNGENATNTTIVPDSSSAVRIAEAVWIGVYGPEVLDKKPYTATLVNSSYWIVKGSLSDELGGVPYIEIRKNDGCVQKITHTK